MRALANWRLWAAVAFLAVLVSSVALAAPEAGQDQDEREDGFFELFDDAGRSLTMTVRNLAPGDGYIASDNRYYVVDKIDGDKVIAKYKETIELPKVDAVSAKAQQRSSLSWLRAQIQQLTARITRAQNTEEDDNNREAGQNDQDDQRETIAIYATHSDESYVPTSGKASEEEGDILNVAKTLGESLEELGYRAIVSDRSHLPRDGEVYLRSRRTAFDLLKTHRPATIIDVHRDAVPASVYETTVKGEDMVKVRLVVGRQNQNREATLEYAKRIKAVADKEYPGLVEGIFDAKGNYNQDLSPKAILMEFGTHVTDESKARAAAKLMARVLPAAAGLAARDEKRGAGAGTTRAESRQGANQAGSRSLWWILGIGVALAVGLMLVNKEKGKHVKGFFSKEFANSIGVRADKKKDDQNTDDQDTDDQGPKPDSDDNPRYE